MTKKRILKKVISIILMLATLSTVVTVFSGCGFLKSNPLAALFGKEVVGTEGAKLLLARERLDEELVGQKLNIFTTSQQSEATADDKKSDNNKNFFEDLFKTSGFTASSIDSIPFVGGNLAEGVTVGGDSVVWNSFKDASELKASYLQFIEPIDQAAANTAELIAKIKSDVGVTEKWVEAGDSKYMLIVEESSETIIEYYEPHNSINVSVRYTTDDARCVYEMYSFMTYDDGTTGDIRNMCIPGEYYEYTYRNSGGFNDYFIADKSRGYWMMNRFRFDSSSAFFSMAAIKCNVGYGVDVSVDVNEDGSLVLPSSFIDASMFSPNSNIDLLTVSGGDGLYRIGVYMTNVKSGIASLSAPSGAYYFYPDYGHVGDVYLARRDYGVDNGVEINLSNGGRITVGQLTENISYTETRVDYNMFFGEETYTGKIDFEVHAESEKEAYRLLEEYLSSNGIILRATEQEINEAYSHCQLLHDNYDVMEWYGLPMNSLQNLTEAENRLKADFVTYRGKYEAVKNYETVTSLSFINAPTSFGGLTVTSAGSASYTSNGIIKIEGLTAHTESSELFEEGQEYSLKLGLARLDENGSYSSANTVTLDTNDGAELPSAQMNDELELTLSGEFSLPLALTEGEYVVVVYYATADEGIRVTEMAPVAFYSADEGVLETNFKLMDVSVKRIDENLHVTYKASLSDRVISDEAKGSYTYEEIERILIRGILTKGYPVDSATLQDENGKALAAGERYGAGTYRLKFLTSTSEGLVEAYMYTTLK